MPPRTSPKKDAVLAIGLDRPTAEIISAAKANGFAVSGTYVDILKKNAAGGSATPARRKVSAGSTLRRAGKQAARNGDSADGATTKADYVRRHASLMPAEIMEKAQEDGVQLSLAYVYNIRKNANKTGPQRASPARGAEQPVVARRGPGRPRKTAPSAEVASTRGGTDERALRGAVVAYVVEHGLAAARRVLDEVAMKIRAAGAH